MSAQLFMTPIGTVRSDRIKATDDHWLDVNSRIELDPTQYEAQALAGLDDFSHVEVFFVFHQVRDEKIVTGARHPRGRSDWPKVGIFSQRGKNRPNRLGATICEIIEVEGLSVHVRGLDAIDASPVLDLKPVMREFLPGTRVRQPEWAVEVMANYW